MAEKESTSYFGRRNVLLNFLQNLKEQADLDIKNVTNSSELETIKYKYLGKKGALTKVLKSMGSIPSNERPAVGAFANELRKFLEKSLNSAQISIDLKLRNDDSSKGIDVTISTKRKLMSKLHPLTTVLNEIIDVFTGMGFNIVDGPELETCFNNFEALNIPPYHPSCDMRDTFYVNDSLVLRTHTSPVQIRTLKTYKPPMRIVTSGRVYRKDTIDATHSPMFHQIEGLVIDRSISMSHLKGTLKLLINKIYDSDAIRFRPHYFPFTEPSAEVDVSCFFCEGKGCSVCKYSGWIEVLGAGMVHPRVLERCGVDPNEYRGFAFGIGLERIVMFKYGIEDLRLFYENDIKFLTQF